MAMRVPATPAMVAVAALWALVPLLGMTGRWLPGLFVAVALMVLLATLGSAHRGAIRVGFLLFPIVAWGAVWALAFWLAARDRDAAGSLFGFHPSFAWIVLGYWLTGVVVLTGGFLLRREEWLPETRWREFRERVARPAAEREGESDDAAR